MTTCKKYRNFMATVTADRVASIHDLAHLCALLTNCECAIMRHDRDVASDHYHIAIAYESPRSISSVAKALKMPENFIEKWDERKSNLWSYLIHATDKASAEKYHYDEYLTDPEKCWANFDVITAINNISKGIKNKRDLVRSVAGDILIGKISKRDLLAPDMLDFYYDNKRKLDTAIQCRHESLRLHPPKCITLLISGRSGVGKTTKADELARVFAGASVCWASSANDPLQDYTDEKCIIFDDFRPQDYEWQNLLALLDPNFRQRTHASRYYNKVLATEVIILTSVLSLDDIINYYNSVNDEPKKQLRRRIQNWLDMNVNEWYEYDDISDSYRVLDEPFTIKKDNSSST